MLCCQKRHKLHVKILRSVYCNSDATLESHLCYASLALYLKNPKFVIKSFNKTAIKNCIFISTSLNGLLSSVFNSWFKFSFEANSHNTWWSYIGYFKITSYHTKTYDRYLMLVNVSNHLQNCHHVIFTNIHVNNLLILQRINLTWSLFRTFSLVLVLL